jgi:NAD+ diphosphatase
MSVKLPVSVLVVVHTEALDVLLLERAARAGFWQSVTGSLDRPGEPLEAAAAREVREETGVEIAELRYHGSQPWPFPASMMIGFHAQPTRDAIRLDGQELEAARWFTRADIVAGLAGGQLSLSPHRSIAWQLVADWFDREGLRLATVPGA